MDRATSERMNADTTTKSGEITGSGCWETPPEVFGALHREFKFDIDLTGGPGTQHRLPIWLGPESPIGLEDALTAKWTDRLRPLVGFSNPIYGSFIPKILDKAYLEATRGFTSVFLLPNRVTGWYKKAMRLAAEIRIVDERIAFWEEGHPRWNAKILREEGRRVPDPAMFDSCIVVIRPPSIHIMNPGPPLFPRADFDLWHWDPARLAKCRLTA